MASVLLDTHILVWWRADRKRLSATQKGILEKLERAGDPVAMSAISLREIAALAARGRLTAGVSMETWLGEIDSNPLLTVLPITTAVAAESVRLGGDAPKDPADQIIIATARCYNLRLLTADQQIRRWAARTQAFGVV